MHRSRPLAAAAPPAPAGLRVLAELVLAELAHRLAPEPLAVTAGAGRLAMASDALTIRAGARHRVQPPSGGSETGPEDAGSSVMVAEHAEVWALVRAAQDGDGEAFGQLYDRYVDTVYRYVYFRLGDRTLAEDFTSETFLRALRRIGGISYQGRDIGAWFVTIARNIVLDHLKSARHRLELSTGDILDGGDTAPGPEATVLGALTADRLMAGVKRLGEEQRECVVLRFVQGLSVAETAEVMGKNAGAIKALQHRAVRKLAELVGPDLR